jgi:hypothetical protein
MSSAAQGPLLKTCDLLTSIEIKVDEMLRLNVLVIDEDP